MLDRASGATAFPNRDTLSIFSIECGASFDADNTTELIKAQATFTSCLLIVNQVMEYVACWVASTPSHCPLDRVLDAAQPNSQYGGYLSPNEVHWQDAYFGTNYPRLQKVKAAYDPINMFSKPFTPQAVSS